MLAPAKAHRGPSHAAMKAARAQALMERNATREEEASFVFHKFDASRRGSLGEEELYNCFTELGFSNGRQNKTEAEIREWVRRELKRGDKAGDGKLSYEEFVDYYNRFVVGHRRQFEDTYELGARVGKGAFGCVYRAKRIGGSRASTGGGGVATGEQVAVKRVLKERGVKMELIHNEITIWEQLKHPNLVQLLDVFESDEHLFLVTELMRGGDLFKKLEKVTSFSESVAARFARQIVSAVAHLHAHGVVHCDLKPSNILVAERTEDELDAENLTVKIADFGLSQSLQIATKGSSPTLLTEVCGTPDYFAPELAALAQGHGSPVSSAALSLVGEEGKGYGPPLDCWAVGCIVYELLAGNPPYQAQDESVLFYKICENAMEFPQKSFEAVSPEAIALIRAFTITDPAQRLSCAEALNHHWLAAPHGDEPLQNSAASLLPTDLPKKRRMSADIRDSIMQRRASFTPAPDLEELASIKDLALSDNEHDGDVEAEDSIGRDIITVRHDEDLLYE